MVKILKWIKVLISTSVKYFFYEEVCLILHIFWIEFFDSNLLVKISNQSVRSRAYRSAWKKWRFGGWATNGAAASSSKIPRISQSTEHGRIIWRRGKLVRYIITPERNYYHMSHMCDKNYITDRTYEMSDIKKFVP